MKEVFEYVIKKIVDAQIIQEPYPHILISGIFPDEFYSVLLEQIPNTSTYTSKPKYPGRKTMTLDNFDILDEEKKEFWKEVYGFLKSDKFANILLQKLKMDSLSLISMLPMNGCYLKKQKRRWKARASLHKPFCFHKRLNFNLKNMRV